MKYYLHDTSAFDDEKVTELYIHFGYEGVGMFYVILEKIGKQEKPVKTEVLKKQLRVGKKLEKCWKFMEEIGLISSNNGETFNKQLLNFSQKYLIKKEKNAKRISEWRKNQELTENVTHYEQQCNTPKDNISKVKESKEIINSEFSFFFKKYPGTKKGESTEFGNLKKKYKDWKQICGILNDCLDKQIEAKETNRQNGAFVPQWKNLQTYINQRAWEEVIPIQAAVTQNGKAPEKSVFQKNMELYERTQAMWDDKNLYDENGMLKINQF